MFKELQITLYDVFGYLLPGAIIVIALVVLFWALFWPTATLPVYVNPPPYAVFCLLFLAYLAGHLGQGVGNLIEKLPAVKRTVVESLPISDDLAELVRRAVGERFGEKAKSLKPKELLLLCDQALVHAGSPGEREIFVYREGFYRGNCVALAFLALTVILRMVRSPSLIFVDHRTLEIGRYELGLFALVSGIGAWLSFKRYLRFACHKNSSCLTRFLAFSATPSKREGKS